MKNACYIILAGSLWGIISIFVSILNAAGFHSLQCVEIRSFFTALLLFLYLFLTDRHKLKIRIRDIPYFIGTGIFSIVFFNYCYFEAINVTGSAAVPALLLYTAPIFVMVLSAIFFHESVTVPKLIALAMTFIGLGFVTGAFSGEETLSVKVLILGLGAGFGYALYSIFGKCIVGKYDAYTITFYTFVIAAIGTLSISGITENITQLFQISSLLSALGLALFSTVLPFLFYTKGLIGIDAGKASILATVEPFVAAIVGALFFHEQFTTSKVIGMLLIVFAIVYLNIGGQKVKQ